jgi:hypothetical protein
MLIRFAPFILGFCVQAAFVINVLAKPVYGQ